jgi:Na+-transporting methylmalonyl-CoA/oxaloacetate decarboxylase gamma subunit
VDKPTTTAAENGSEWKASNPARANPSITDWGMLIITGVGVVVAVCTLRILVRQAGAAERAANSASENAIAAKEAADAAKNSSDTARLALVAGQRAFVHFPYEVSVLKIPREDDPMERAKSWQIRLPISNEGSTPAVELRMRVNWHCRDTELPADYSYPDYEDPEHGQTIGNEHIHRIMPKSTIHAGPLEIPKDIMDRVRHKQRHLYFYGWARYKDVFDGTAVHQTFFCHEGKIFETSKGATLLLNSFPHHNEAD